MLSFKGRTNCNIVRKIKWHATISGEQTVARIAPDSSCAFARHITDGTRPLREELRTIILEETHSFLQTLGIIVAPCSGLERVWMLLLPNRTAMRMY